MRLMKSLGFQRGWAGRPVEVEAPGEFAAELVAAASEIAVQTVVSYEVEQSLEANHSYTSLGSFG